MVWDNLPVADSGETPEVETWGREKIVLCFCRVGVFKINFLKTWDPGLRASLRKLICNYIDSELHGLTQLWRYVYISRENHAQDLKDISRYWNPETLGISGPKSENPEFFPCG